jgi:hypothetical protein
MKNIIEKLEAQNKKKFTNETVSASAVLTIIVYLSYMVSHLQF